MYFISYFKFKKKPNKALLIETQKLIDADTKAGAKFLSVYWTLGRYDGFALFEAPNEKVAMKMAMSRSEIMDTETLVAVPRDEVKNLVD